MTDMTTFRVQADGDDGAIKFSCETYGEAEDWARNNSHNWLGMRMLGPSGKIATYKDGELTGFKDGSGNWVTV